MRSIADIVEQCRLSGRSFSEQALAMESEETGVAESLLRTGMLSRLKDMEFSVREAVSKEWRGLIVPAEAHLIEQYAGQGGAFSGPYVLSAARIAMAVSTYNAAMGRIVAAPPGISAPLHLPQPGNSSRPPLRPYRPSKFPRPPNSRGGAAAFFPAALRCREQFGTEDAFFFRACSPPRLSVK
jgi:hypothetical protein